MDSQFWVSFSCCLESLGYWQGRLRPNSSLLDCSADDVRFGSIADLKLNEKGYVDTDQFWAIIDQSREAAGGDAEGQLLHLEALLSGCQAADIVAFDRTFSELHNLAYTWPLWGAAYLIGGGCSDDGFMDFRGWLISRGQHVFERALADPDSLADGLAGGKETQLETQVEGFQYVAKKAWSTTTGNAYSEFPRHKIDYRSEPTGDEWQEDDLPDLFPKLASKFE